MKALYDAVIGALPGGPRKVQKEYKASFSEAFTACQSALKSCLFFIREEDVQTGTIMATTKPSIWSWGEVINITIKQQDNRVQEVIAESSPKAQLFDWGRSKDNVSRFFHYLDKLLEIQL